MAKKKKKEVVIGEGMKFDSNKPMWNLLPMDIISILNIDKRYPLEDKKLIVSELLSDIADDVNSECIISGIIHNIANLMDIDDPVKQEAHKEWSTALTWKHLDKLAVVYTYGANKYAPNNWQNVGKDRYFSAMCRHLTAYIEDGHRYDPESGLEHLTHALWNAVTLMWKHKND